MSHAGFDLVAQTDITALDTVADAFVARLDATQVTRYSVSLGTVLGAPLGTLNIELEHVRLTRIRPAGQPWDGALVDVDIEGKATITGSSLPILNTLTGGMTFSFAGVGLDVATTPHGVPTGIKLMLRSFHLQKITPTGVLALLAGLFNLLTPILQAGFQFATTLVPTIDIPIKELVDIFVLLGIRFRAVPGQPQLTSPLVTAAGTTLLVAADFERQMPPPAGVASQIPSLQLIPSGANIAAAVGEGGVNQAIDLAFQKGWIPASFKEGGFTFHVREHTLQFLDATAAPGHFHGQTGAPLGAMELRLRLTAKRKKCCASIRATIKLKVRLWPWLEVTPAPGGGPDVETLKFDFRDENQVVVSGYLVLVAQLIFGPQLLLYLLLITQIVDNLVIPSLLPYTVNVALGATNVLVTATSAHLTGPNPASFFQMKLDFGATVTGAGEVDLAPYRSFLVVDQTTFNANPGLQSRLLVHVDFPKDAIHLEHDEMRLAARVS